MVHEVDAEMAATGVSAPGDGAARPEPGRKRWASFRIFSSATDAPQARRPTDAVLFLLATLGIIVLSFPAPGPTTLDTATANFVASLPGLIGWFWEITYALLLIWSVALLLVALFAKGRKRLFLDELLAMAFALGFAVVAGQVSGTEPSTSMEGLFRSSSPPIYLAVRVALATAMVVTASPHMSRPIRYVGRWLLLAGAIGGVALGAVLPIGVLAGFLIGFGAAALTHLLVGSPAGRLTREQVVEALAELGVEATDVIEAPLQPSGVALASATGADGRPLSVKILGRDAWDGQLFAKVWRSLTLRGGGRHVGVGRQEQVEHEAFVSLLAERAGVPVAPVVAAGMTSQGDALLVLGSGGRPIASLSDDEFDDALLTSAWNALGAMHAAGISHGHVDGQGIVVRPDGSLAFVDLGLAKVGPLRGDLMADRAQLLVTTALAVGSERAVSVAIEVLGPDGTADALPFLQPAVFDRDAKQGLRDRDLKLKDLRELVAERTAREVPPLEPLRRFTWATLAKFAIAGLLAYAFISVFADVGIDTIIKEFQSADWAWLVAALVLTPFVQVPQAFSTMGATLISIKFWPVLMLQFGVQFISLAVPSSAARIALEVRFFERVGVPGAGAIMIGAIDSFSTFILQMILIVVILVSGTVSIDLSSDGGSSSGGSSSSVNWEAILIAVALVVVALIIAYLVPKTRAKLKRFREMLRQKRADAKEALVVVRHPSKLALLLGGNLVAQVMLAIILGLCLRAFGYSTSLAALILVNTFVSLFAGFMPVPGGVGVAEAAYTTALIAIGIPEAAATSTAMAYRLVTFYLPPLWGTFAMRWMKQNSYL